MFCKYCGKSIPDGSQVCTYCGQRLTKTAAAQPEPEETYTEQEPKKKNTGMVTLVIFMAGLILVLIVALIMSSLMSKAPDEPDKGKTDVTEATAGDVTEAEPGLPADNIYAEAFQSYEAYVLPGSDSSYKCYTDIEALTEEALMVAEQEIYARHGQKFSDAGDVFKNELLKNMNGNCADGGKAEHEPDAARHAAQKCHEQHPLFVGNIVKILVQLHSFKRHGQPFDFIKQRFARHENTPPCLFFHPAGIFMRVKRNGAM